MHKKALCINTSFKKMLLASLLGGVQSLIALFPPLPFFLNIPFGLKALYRNIIIPQNENERERNTDIRLIKHLNGHLPNAHNTIPAAHKTSIGIFKKKGRGGNSAIRLCTPPRSDASNIFLNEVF